MIVVVTADSAEVLEPEVLTALTVRSALPAARLAEAVARQRIGRADADGSHVWLEPALLHGSDGDDSDRVGAVAGMIAYAAGRGWVDDAGRVRAHVEAAAV